MNHLIMGAAINAVVNSLSDPSLIFKDYPEYDQIKSVSNEKFYPINLYVDMTNYLEEKFNDKITFLKLGKTVGRTVIETSLSKMNLTSVKEAIHALQKAHEQFCQPVKGEFKVISETERAIILKYTAPYNCVLQEGLLREIAGEYGGKFPLVIHKECRREGKSACIFEIKYVQRRMEMI
jgi:predicted hydrocarbon binding protein